jgi:hypothetical protein
VSWLTSMRQNLNEKCIHNQMHEFNWAWSSVVGANQEWTLCSRTTIFIHLSTSKKQKKQYAQHSKKTGDQTLNQLLVSNVEDCVVNDSLLTGLG